jgi:hypothetical protein
MDALNRSRNNLIAGAVLIFFALAYYSLIYRYGLNLADEGNVALISQRLMCGERPSTTYPWATMCSGFTLLAYCSNFLEQTCS